MRKDGSVCTQICRLHLVPDLQTDTGQAPFCLMEIIAMCKFITVNSQACHLKYNKGIRFACTQTVLPKQSGLCSLGCAV